MRHLVSVLLAVAVVMVAGAASERAVAQDGGSTPFGFEGRDVTSLDGVEYTMYSGDVPSFDGLPLAADVTVPKGAEGPLPLVVMFHGYTQDRTYWESETADNPDPIRDEWNNVSFAKRGYAVLNYTIRGFQDSCGPRDAKDQAACLPREYWIHLADPRYEIHDAQHLIGLLVDDGTADPENIGVTGQSYGGGHSWLLALQNDKTVNPDYSVTPWKSPNGTPLSIEVAVPQFTWSSLTNALLPNGRARDDEAGTPQKLANPVGTPIQSYLAALNGGGAATGSYAPPGVDPTSDLTTWFARFNQGDPYRNDASDPIVRRVIRELDRRSPLYVEPDARVPIYQNSGFTDPLFPPVQAVQMIEHVKDLDPRYPIKSYFGDIGHEYAANPQDEWDTFHKSANAFVDYYLKDRGKAPTFDVTAQTTLCEPGDGGRATYTARGFLGLAKYDKVFASGSDRTTSSAAAGPEGPATDPIGKKGCPIVPQAASDPGAAVWTFPVKDTFNLAGQPELTLNLRISGRDAQSNVRIWDQEPDGTMTLVSRGTYRHGGTPGKPARVSYQTSANAYRFPKGHTLRVEVTGNDSPYYRPNNQPFTTAISSMRLSVPAR